MFPNQQTELALLQRYRWVISLDEVGRGALAGPVAVGAVKVDSALLAAAPVGIKDSKLLSRNRRTQVAAAIESWVRPAVGMSSAAEIESLGILKALSLAATRALEPLPEDCVILLDGNQNWLEQQVAVPVQVRVKADRDCLSVAAASVAAKVARDEFMVQLADHYPGYGWENNAGYSSAQHIAALREFGPSAEHRVSWLTRILEEPEPFF
jgi:ribonuclease HII